MLRSATELGSEVHEVHELLCALGLQHLKVKAVYSNKIAIFITGCCDRIPKLFPFSIIRLRK